MIKSIIMHMKATSKFTLLLIAVAPFSAFVGCKSDPASPNGGAYQNVMVRSEMSSSTVHSSPGIAKHGGSDHASALFVDSMQITSAKMLVSGIALSDNELATQFTITSSTSVLSADQNGAQMYAVGNVPDGNYGSIGIQFHRMTDGESSADASNATFAGFTGSDRPSVVISGVAYKDGYATPFVYNGKVDAVVNYKLSNLHIYPTITTMLILTVNPEMIFKDKISGLVRDPSDAAAKLAIDSDLQAGLSIVHK